MLKYHQLVLGFLGATAIWAVAFVLQSQGGVAYAGYLFDSAAITAAATIAIAWFTLTLRRSTDRLWEAGERQLEHLKEISQQQLGAYVGVESCEVVSADWGNTFIVEVRIKNAGQTPAFNVTHSIKADLQVLHGDPLNFDLPDRNPGKLPIAPGFLFALRAPIAIGGASGTTSIEVGQRTIFVWGRIDYEDVFDKPQHLPFRFRNGEAIRKQVGDAMKTVGFRMEPCDEGNSAT